MTERKPKPHSYYTELRRSDQRKYHNPTTQKQMLEDRITLGEEGFYSGKEPKAELAQEITKVIQDYLNK